MWYLIVCLLAAVIGLILNAPIVTAGTITVCALVALVVPKRPASDGVTDCIIYDEIARDAAHIVYVDGAEDTEE